MKNYNDFVDLFFQYINYLKEYDQPQNTIGYDNKKIDYLFSNKAIFDKFYEQVIKQNVYDSSDNIKIFKLFTDWYSSLSNIITEHKFQNDPLKATTDTLDDLIHSFGMPYFYWIPKSNKSQFFLNLVNLYHIKGSSQAISKALSFVFNIENDLYEYWLLYDKPHRDIYFKGYPSNKDNFVHTIVPYIIKPYNVMDKEPHWYYTKEGILSKLDFQQISEYTPPSGGAAGNIGVSALTLSTQLPSLTPFFDVVLAADIEETKKAYLYLSYLARCELNQWNSTGDISDKRVWDYPPFNDKISLIEAILAYDILFNEKYNRFLSADHTTNRDIYNVACGTGVDQFKDDYEDAFGIIDITNSEHDDIQCNIYQPNYQPDRLETIIIENEIKTKNLPTVKLQETNAITYKMKAIIPGGLDNNGNVSDKCIRFDLYNNKWEECNYNLPKPLRNHAVFSNDNFMFVMGGIDNNNQYNDKIYVLDLINEQWYQMPYNNPFALIDFSYVMLNEYEVFIVGGFDLATASFSNKTYVLNFIHGTYKELDEMPGIGKIKMGIAIDQDKKKIFVSGGWHNHLAYSESYIYDLELMSWITVNNDLEKRACNYIVYDGERNFVNLGGLKIVDNLSESYIESVIDDIIYQFDYRRGFIDINEKVQTSKVFDFDPNMRYDDYTIVENPLLTTYDYNTNQETDYIVQDIINENQQLTIPTYNENWQDYSYLLTYLEINEYVPYYLQYLDALRLFYKPIFHETKFNLDTMNWDDLIYNTSTVIIDSSYPNVHHMYHNVFILQPLVAIIDSGTGLQTRLEVSDNVYVKRFTKEDKNWFAHTELSIVTLDEPGNISRREKYEEKLGNRWRLFTYNNSIFADDEDENKLLLGQINPDLYNFVMTILGGPEEEYNEAIYYLLLLLDDVAGYYGFKSTFRVLNINAIQEILTKIIDFYKPIHSRQLVTAIVVLPFNNRTYNTVYIDDYLRILANLYLEDYYTVEDNWLMTINMFLTEKMQWAYNYDYWYPDWTYNQFDWYTVHNELHFLLKYVFEDNVNYNDYYEFLITNYTEENVNINSRTDLTLILNFDENIQFAANYDMTNQTYDEYTIYDNLDIQINNV